MINALLKKIEARKARVCVVGLGYVGLPYAVAYAKKGFPVLGIDIDARRVNAVKNGKSYIPDIPSAEIATLVAKGTLSASTTFREAGKCDILNICVPTPLNKTRDPDMFPIVSAFQAVRDGLRKGQLYILSSTTYPGTTSELVLPLLEEKAASRKLAVGRDFFLAFSPERIDPGNKKYSVAHIPKVVGGITPRCRSAAKAFYEQVVPTVFEVSSCDSAEMVKLLENTFRSINIGLVNEVALMCDRLGINVWEVIEAASTKPYGFMPFFPGPGLGGHCIPVDPNYLSWKLRALDYRARFIELAEDVNRQMPLFVVEKCERAMRERLGKTLLGAKVLVLGVAYKKDVNDPRESPAYEVITHLREKGAKVSYHDPYVPRFMSENFSLASVPLTRAGLKSQDAVLVLTDHSVFAWKDIVPHCRLVFDTRNAVKGDIGAARNVARL